MWRWVIKAFKQEINQVKESRKDYLPRNKWFLKLPEEKFESTSEYMDVVNRVENSKVALVDL